MEALAAREGVGAWMGGTAVDVEVVAGTARAVAGGVGWRDFDEYRRAVTPAPVAAPAAAMIAKVVLDIVDFLACREKKSLTL